MLCRWCTQNILGKPLLAYCAPHPYTFTERSWGDGREEIPGTPAPSFKELTFFSVSLPASFLKMFLRQPDQETDNNRLLTEQGGHDGGVFLAM